MALFLVGLVLFIGIHSIRIIANDRVDAFRDRIGAGPYKGLYSLISLAGLVFIVMGYGDAAVMLGDVWYPPVWTRHLAALLMVPAFVLLVAAYFPGRIKRAVKHPMVASVKIWAFAHLLANGRGIDLLLFGAFLAWAVVARISMKRRASEPMLHAPESALNDGIAIGAGILLWAVMAFYLHGVLFAVAPFG